MKWLALPLLGCSLAISGCNREAPEAEQPKTQTFHEVMKDEIDLRADVVWAIGNAAIGDQAGIDPAKMTDAKWEELAAGADSVRESTLKIVRMNPLILAPPGVKIADEDAPGGHSGAAVQERFDQEPQKLRDMATVLAVHMEDLARAARAHDATRAGVLIDQLDGVCESCHLEFWYPDQKAFVEEYLRNAP